MAHRYGTNGKLSNQTRLPPIRQRCSTAQNPKSQVSEDDYSPVDFIKLPRLESRSTLKSKTSLSFQEREETNESFKRYATIEKNFPPLRQAAVKHGTGSLGCKGENRRGETHIHSRAHRIDGVYLEGDFLKHRMTKHEPIAEKVFRRPVQLLRRRLKPCKAYQCTDRQMSHDELLSFEQSMDQISAFTERDKMIELKDFNGKMIHPSKGNSDITSYIAMFEVEGSPNKSSGANNCASPEKSCVDEETNARVRGRFYEALDYHFYHYYRNTHPGRRMAICEEIERNIVVDDLALTCFREHLSLQDIMNTCML